LFFEIKLYTKFKKELGKILNIKKRVSGNLIDLQIFNPAAAFKNIFSQGSI
tara:strand:- start:304 stop:456 length:153 start_codon:yes stop_codon:yes gene_type:complete